MPAAITSVAGEVAAAVQRVEALGGSTAGERVEALEGLLQVSHETPILIAIHPRRFLFLVSAFDSPPQASCTGSTSASWPPSR